MTTPAHKIRIGNLSAIIWRNSGENGPWYSVQPRAATRTATTSGGRPRASAPMTC